MNSERIKQTPILNKNKKNTLDIVNLSYNDAEVMSQTDK